MDEIRPTIGIDASKLAKQIKSGTEYYTQEIIRNIIDLGDNDINIVLYCKKPLSRSFGPLPPNTSVKIMGFPPRLWTQIRLSIETTLRPPSVLFVPAHTIPPVTRCPIVTTIHDLGFRKYPALYPALEKIYHKYSMKQAIKRADKIISISHATKADIIKYYPRAKSKNIEYIYHGLNAGRYRPLRAGDQLRFQPKWDKYILFIGRLEAKKNILGIVKSYALLRKERGIKHKLVLAGKPKFEFDKVRQYIDKLTPDVKKDIILPGYIGNSDLPVLLREADIFLFPTFFEGFGMPILEAFASGVPVVTSNTTSCPEIAGEAAIVVDPYKPLAIASACSKLINKPDVRRNYIRTGFHRSKQFSWQKSARATLDVLKSSIN